MVGEMSGTIREGGNGSVTCGNGAVAALWTRDRCVGPPCPGGVPRLAAFGAGSGEQPSDFGAGRGMG